MCIYHHMSKTGNTVISSGAIATLCVLVISPHFNTVHNKTLLFSNCISTRGITGTVDGSSNMLQLQWRFQTLLRGAQAPLHLISVPLKIIINIIVYYHLMLVVHEERDVLCFFIHSIFSIIIYYEYELIHISINYLLTESEVMPGNIKRDLNVSTERQRG